MMGKSKKRKANISVRYTSIGGDNIGEEIQKVKGIAVIKGQYNTNIHSLHYTNIKSAKESVPA